MSSAIITAFATIAVALLAFMGSMVSIYLAKKKEREAAWNSEKLCYYKEFFAAASGIVGQPPDEAKTRFATSVNNLHLIASDAVLKSLHAFTDEISARNAAKFTQTNHDRLWSRLVWDIRADLGDAPCRNPDHFRALLWASGVSNPG